MGKHIDSISLFKILCCLLVICIHSGPFKPVMHEQMIYMYLAGFIDQFSRLAVPFFFIASGYFYKPDGHEKYRSILIRLMKIFAFWSLIYLLMPTEYLFSDHSAAPYSLKFAEFAEDPMKLVFEGGRSHLWFLSSLFFTVMVFHFFSIRTGLLIALLLYLVGCALGSYSTAVLGSELRPDIDTRNGLFLAALCWMLGRSMSVLARENSKLIERITSFAPYFFIFGFLGHFAEIFLLKKFYDVSFIRHDYVLSTVVFAFGFFMLALRMKGAYAVASVSPLLRSLAPIVLGIYLIHPIVIDLMNYYLVPQIHEGALLVWQVGYVFVIFGTSLIAIKALGRSSYLERFLL